MTVYFGPVTAGALSIELMVSNYDAPHGTIQVEADDCSMEFTLDNEKIVELRDMLTEWLRDDAVPTGQKI